LAFIAEERIRPRPRCCTDPTHDDIYDYASVKKAGILDRSGKARAFIFPLKQIQPGDIMRHINLALVALTAAVLSACGGSNNNNNTPAKPQFAAQVTFGDSLSDVGTYRVGTVAALGGGKYTINGDNTSINAALHGKNWTELMAASFSLSVPCAAVTGLDGDATKGFAVPITNNLTCTNYAQGGARVTNPVGPGHKLTGAAIGQLTHPIATQIATHLARNNGSFKSTDMVIVMAGGNDALSLLGGLSAAATAAGAAEGAKVGAQTFATSLATQLGAGATNPTTATAAIGAAIATESARAGSTSQTVVGAAVQAAATQPGNSAVASAAVYGPMVAKAQDAANTAGATAGAAAGNAYASANGPALVPAMGVAGAELANLIRTQIIGKGAQYVILNNLPDLASSPSGKAASAAQQQLIAGMVNSFNIALRVGIDGLDAKIVYVDLAAASADQVANPAKYGISNATKPACGANALGTTSLVCNKTNVIAGDVSTYLFADDVHPAPYGQTLIHRAVTDELKKRGWL
jgi:outer membrane lipase/esterase